MSYHEGSNWQAKKEDEGKPLYDNKDKPAKVKVAVQEEGDYDSIYMDVIMLVEKDNIDGDLYTDTMKKLKEKYIIKLR